MKRFLPIVTLLLATLWLWGCNPKTSTDSKDSKLHENCYLKPDPGPCRMAIKRYYYDEKEKKCKEFIYGGCKGTVPFETLKACQTGCGCGQ